ncbi:MAG: hypothetical protein ABSF55_00285 [Candidatus Staskawiczbacteria bacterium]|jgi:hypothetical protein
MKKSLLIIVIVVIAVLCFVVGMLVDNKINSAALSFPLSTHMQCVNQKCVVVAGAGKNQCSTNGNCVLATPTTHTQCVNQKCVVLPGIGISQCAVDSNCVPATHLPATH